MVDNMQELYDIYGIWHQPFWQTTTFYWGIIVFVTLLGSTIFYIFFRRYLRSKRRLTPWQEALQELQKLQNYPVLNQHDVKHIYFSLTAVLKKYMMTHYKCARMGYTDHEFLSTLADYSVPESVRNDLTEIFSGTISIKFAQQDALAQQISQDLARAMLCIQKTVPSTAKS